MTERIPVSLAALFVGSILAFACSGSDEAQVPSADPVPSSGAPAPSSSTGSAAPGGGSSGAPAPGGGSTTSDAGKGEGGPGGTSNTTCAAGATVEAEDNDTEAKANALPAMTGSFCGALSTAADVDYVTFTLPADAKSLAFGSSFSKVGVDFEVSVEGKTFLVGDTPEVKPGKPYVIKAFTTGGAPVDYRLSVTIGK